MAERDARTLLERCFESSQAEATEALGAALSAGLEPGSVIALSGELGAGKTCFARGVAGGLGVTEPVTSPTYTLMHAYQGRVPVYHLDAWMERRGEAFLSDGGAEWLHAGGIALVEWAERVEGWLPLPRLEVLLGHAPEGKRTLTIRVLECASGASAAGDRLAQALEALALPVGVRQA